MLLEKKSKNDKIIVHGFLNILGYKNANHPKPIDLHQRLEVIVTLNQVRDPFTEKTQTKQQHGSYLDSTRKIKPREKG